jgi:trk system potassium uptake protein TrkH
LALLGVDFLTAFTATATAMGNVGPGLGTVGPVENFAHLPQAAKWLLMWCMLLGRLELFTVLVLLLPEFWRT